MNNIEALKQLALSKVTFPQARKNVHTPADGVERHNVDFLARIKGEISIFPDEDYIPTAEIPIKATLALFIRYCGVTRDAAIKALTKAMTESLQAAENSVLTSEDHILNAIDEERIIDDCMERVYTLARELPMKTRNGKVTKKLDVVFA